MPKDECIFGSPPARSSRLVKKKKKVVLSRPIGRGTFSQVFLSRDEKSGEPVAVKVMDLTRYVNEFETEISIMMILMNQGINVGFRSSESDEENDFGYIIMDYFPYPTLTEFIEKCGTVKEKDALNIFIKVIEMVEQLHSCRIAHKDLKPDNIFVDPATLKVRVIDFGLSVFVLGNNFITEFCGSPLYMPPEVLNKEAYDPMIADIWSLGVILLEMLLGTNPWTSAETVEHLIHAIEQELVFPSHFSTEIVKLLSEILVLDPQKRVNLQQLKQRVNFLCG